ncbi:11100_t:CDS:2 [Paraglomus brasilianum]|uniref:11100_t:CDS:1 n=1 Tax=Paraglomus brasilianum TaxID=144538 RepID=A0A9N9G240_9GLOM|nr:11100_t:CDS:2 [Paraglomus brasilianum]
MSDLENEILALAGDQVKKNKNAENDEPSEEESQSQVHNDREEPDSDIGDGAELEDSDEYDEDGYRDDEDRRQLEAMPEVEREKILADRMEKKQRRADLRRLREEEKQVAKRKVKDTDGTRKSARAKSQKSTKQVLDDARRARTERNRNRAAGKSSHPDELEASSGDEKLSEDHDEGEFGDDEMEQDEPRYSRKTDDDTPADYDDLLKIVLTRRQIEKWLFAPYFNKTAIGCYARVYLGTNDSGEQIYRLCEVIGVVPFSSTYKVENTLTDQALLMRHGNAQKAWPISGLSNSKLTYSEWERWLKVIKVESGQVLPTKGHIEKKLADIQAANNYSLDEREVAEMVKAKQALRGSYKNLAAEKADLLHRKAVAEAEKNEDDVRKIQRRIEEIDRTTAEQAQSADARLDMWAQLNERNRQKNLQETRMAEERERVMKRKLDNRLSTTIKRHRSPMLREDSIGSQASDKSLLERESTIESISLQKPITRFEKIVNEMDTDVEVEPDPVWERERGKFLDEYEVKYATFKTEIENKLEHRNRMLAAYAREHTAR